MMNYADRRSKIDSKHVFGSGSVQVKNLHRHKGVLTTTHKICDSTDVITFPQM